MISTTRYMLAETPSREWLAKRPSRKYTDFPHMVKQYILSPTDGAIQDVDMKNNIVDEIGRALIYWRILLISLMLREDYYLHQRIF